MLIHPGMFERNYDPKRAEKRRQENKAKASFAKARANRKKKRK